VALTGLAVVDLVHLDPRLSSTEVVVACDVDNPLTGPRGAAHVYGPQKGASPDDVAALDAGLARLARVLHRDLGRDVDRVPGAGAAGGVGAGAVAFLGATLTPGIDLLLDLVGFDDALAGADLVITGEGSFDAQSLSGKAPVGVARRARAVGVPVLVLAGRVDLSGHDRARMHELGIEAAHALLDLEPDPQLAKRGAGPLLRTLAASVLGARLGTTTGVPPQAAPTTVRSAP
jgi:glycerate 2-kinase